MGDFRSRDLGELNQQSETASFALSDLDWSQSPSKDKFWAPEKMSPLFYLSSYQALTDQEKLRCNQIFSLGICEQFIWFENDLLCPVLEKMSRRELPAPLRQALRHFHAEEKKHTEMFWRLLEKAEPSYYRERKFHFFKIPSLKNQVLKMILNKPDVFLVWIWLAILFEERTLDYSRQYAASARKNENLDNLFVEVHRFHMKDEVRHHQLDHYLLEDFYDKEAFWKKQLASALMAPILKAYISPRHTARRIVETVGGEFARLGDEIAPRLIVELSSLRENQPFQEMAFGKNSIGRSLRLIARYDEMNHLWKYLVAVRREDFI